MNSVLPAIYADFNNADKSGRVRLNTTGTQQDLQRLQLTLTEGLQIRLSDDELSTIGHVHYDSVEGWIAVIDWSQL